MKVLVTGATGFIGRYVVPQLLTEGHEVALLVREAYSLGAAHGTPLPDHLQTVRENLHLVYADLRNFRQTVRAVREAQPQAVIHLAAAGATSPFLPVQTAVRHNVDGTIHLLRAVCEKYRGVERIIVGRTPGERTSMNTYAASKAAAWNFCQMYARTQQWPIVGAMIFQSYGYGQPQAALIPGAFRAALADEDFPMTPGTQQRDWIHVSDVANGICGCVSAEIPTGSTIELGTGTLASVADVVRTIYEITASKGRPLVGALPCRPGEEAIQIAAVANNPLPAWRPTHTLQTGLSNYLHRIKMVNGKR